MKNKCPYAEMLKRFADVHIDCKDCPALECHAPKIKEEFQRRKNEKS